MAVWSRSSNAWQSQGLPHCIAGRREPFLSAVLLGGDGYWMRLNLRGWPLWKRSVPIGFAADSSWPLLRGGWTSSHAVDHPAPSAPPPPLQRTRREPVSELRLFTGLRLASLARARLTLRPLGPDLRARARPHGADALSTPAKGPRRAPVRAALPGAPLIPVTLPPRAGTSCRNAARVRGTETPT